MNSEAARMFLTGLCLGALVVLFAACCWMLDRIEHGLRAVERALKRMQGVP